MLSAHPDPSEPRPAVESTPPPGSPSGPPSGGRAPRLSGAHEELRASPERTEFERRLANFGLGERQDPLLTTTVFEDDLEPEER